MIAVRRVALAACFVVLGRAADADPASAPADDFDRLVAINEASLVMLREQALLPADLARDIADATAQIAAEQREPGAARSANYLTFERRLLELAGPEASRLHIGRSRQDIGSTYRRMALRDSLLQVYAALLTARSSLLGLADAHVDTVIPAYTHGVQAQPITLAHYLLAYSAAFGRDAERYEQAYARLNRSPLGAAAMGTSGFPLDRDRLGELLGFDGIVENSYDANLVSSVDSKIDFAQAMATSAIVVGQLMQNLHTQYHDPSPWILLAEERTDSSSIMPQKRNPRPLDAVRRRATAVVGEAHLVVLNAHNVNSGMHDYRPGTQTVRTADTAIAMYGHYADVMAHLVVDPERALAEVDADYATMTEVADVLVREAGVAFRRGYYYASALTTYGRAEGKRPKDLTDAELAAVWRDSGEGGLPLRPARIRRALDPAAMVRDRRGRGGPQPAEVERMLALHRQSLAAGHRWLDAARERLVAADERRRRAFLALVR